MQKLFILSFLLLFSLHISGQSSLSASVSSLDFGTVYEITSDSLPVTLKNQIADSVHIQEIRFYDIFKSTPFSVKTPPFALAPGDSQVVFVYFSPVHNVAHNTEMVIVTDGNRGDLSIDLRGQGKYSNTYYNSTENLSEEALKTALKNRLAQGYIQKSYNEARDEMFMNIDNKKVNGQGAAVNTLECIYTGTTITNFTDRTNAQLMAFNTEHTWPQSLFSQNLPMRSDLFHLFPAWETANTQRSNLPFGVVSNVAWQNGGSKRGDGVFEPRDVHKGTVARAMFYFVIRYQNYLNFLDSQEAILRQWHKSFPPTEINRQRNEDIYAVQNNRNPFIDYPQFVDRITSISATSSAPALTSLEVTDTEIDFDTLKLTDHALYGLVIANTGNQPLNLSGFTSGDAQLTFENITGNAATIAPGEAMSLPVKLTPQTGGTLSTQISFATNATGKATVTIPVTAEIIDNTALEDDFRAAVGIYPNPVNVQLTIQISDSKLLPATCRIFSPAGQLVFTGRMNAAETNINTGNWSPGLYIVQINSGNQSLNRRVLVDR
ncbi:MAG: endonuclease [Bacteroidia bacterium]